MRGHYLSQCLKQRDARLTGGGVCLAHIKLTAWCVCKMLESGALMRF